MVEEVSLRVEFLGQRSTVPRWDGNSLTGSSPGGCRNPTAEAGKLAAMGCKIVSEVRAWAACLRESVAFVLRSRMRME